MKHSSCYLLAAAVSASLFAAMTLSASQLDDGYDSINDMSCAADGLMMHYPQLPDSNGWDVAFYTYWLSDDWLCTESGSVTGIHFWVSHEGYDEVAPPYTGTVNVRIHSNIPADQSPTGYPIPGDALWNRVFTDEVSVYHAGSGEQGWMDPRSGGTGFDPSDHTEYFQYNIHGFDDPFITEAGNTYWLSFQINARIPYIGWKTTVSAPYGGNALWYHYTLQPQWAEVMDPVTSEYLNYAFMINGIPTQPHLYITPQGPNVVLSWQDRGAEDTLESATNLLDSPIPWQDVAATAVLSNGSWLVEDPATNPARFYRLESMWPAPQIDLIEPSLVSTGGGAVIHLIGQDFRAGQWIRIGGILLTDTEFVDSTHLTVTMPALAAGYYDVELVDSCTGETLTLVSMSVETAPDAVVGVRQPTEAAPAEPCACGSSKRGNLHLSSGEFHQSVTDLKIRGRGLDFVWARQYSSRLGPDTTQGNGWDYSYNIHVQQDGTNMVVHNGDGREDTFYQQPDGTYVRNEFFQIGMLDSNDVFTLVFPDKGTWEFKPLDASAEQGKIAEITDRNGNALTCTYDGSGSLTNIADTLNRNIAVGYDTNGRIETVTDFAGRTVTYAYYEAGDAGGSVGDLKSVTSPPVTGTPNGNDFPGGKSVTYTYSKGFSDERLNHNLLAVIDSKGQTNLVNIYAATTNDTLVEFDRVVRQGEEDDGEFIDYSYSAKTPEPANDFAVVKTIVNDRMGNVGEWQYDSRARCLNMRAYTGRADKTGPTTETVNRPANPLRPGDPAYFETRYAWNADSKPTQVEYPNGNSVQNTYEVDFDPDTPRRSRANLRLRTTLPGPLGGDQASITQSFVYDTTFGSCCGFNVATEVTDGRGNTSYHAYDDNGNRTNTIHAVASAVEDFEYNTYGQMTAHILPDNGSGHRRIDEMQYHASGPQAGYLQHKIVDSQNLALTTSYNYDAVGNVIQVVDPLGNDSSNVVNQLNQVVRKYTRAVDTTTGPVRYQRDLFYDANNNLVQVDAQNVDEDGSTASNAYTTTTFAYDNLNRVTNTVQEVDSTHSIATQYAYDANGNRTLVVSGEAGNGNQTNNVVSTLYDERNRPYRTIRAPGHPDQSTSQFDYDANGNLVSTSQGLEDAAPRVTTIAYNGYNQRIASIDPMGNVATTQYDASGNAVGKRVDGELTDLPGSTNNVRLAETAYTFDVMNRRVQTDQAFFDLATGTNIAGGHAVSTTVYSPGSQVIATIDANSHTNTMSYDTANRRSVVTDAKGNSVTYAYDADGNVVSTVEVDLSDLGSPAQTFTTTYAFDALNRMIEMIDNAGNTNSYAYDSHNNRTKFVDAKGSESRYDFDGLGRKIRVIRDMDGDGADPNDADDIVTTQSWDDNSRLVGQTDDNTNTTVYVYDALDQQIAIEFADGTSKDVVYDVHGNIVETTDANGSVVTSSFDLNNRNLARSIALGAGVAGTTSETYAHNGISKIVRASNNDSDVTFDYDSLVHITLETQQVVSSGAPVRTVASTYDALGNQLSCTYPGGRKIDCTYDALNRKQAVSDSPGTIADYSYIGPTSVQRRDYGNGTRTDYAYDAIRRMTNSLQYVIAGGVPIDSRAYAWDVVGNKTADNDLLAPSLDSRSFDYDPAHQMITSQTAVVGPINSYVFDGVGNRVSVTGVNPGSYSMNPPDDDQMNQYSTTPLGDRSHDANGNLASKKILGKEHEYFYDYHNRLVEVARPGSGLGRITFRYDCLGRRIEKSDISALARYYYTEWREIEEQDETNATVATFVWGNGIDELLSMNRGGQDFFYHSDNMNSVRKVTDSLGAVVEQYRYGDYGNPTFLDGGGLPLSGSQIGNDTLFTGRRFDPETGLYYYRTRYLDPTVGRFITRDTIGIWGDAANRGNAFSYVGGNPWSQIDPMGRKHWWQFWLPKPGPDSDPGPDEGDLFVGVYPTEFTGECVHNYVEDDDSGGGNPWDPINLDSGDIDPPEWWDTVAISTVAYSANPPEGGGNLWSLDPGDNFPASGLGNGVLRLAPGIYPIEFPKSRLAPDGGVYPTELPRAFSSSIGEKIKEWIKKASTFNGVYPTEFTGAS